jgi:hypothetical protein
VTVVRSDSQTVILISTAKDARNLFGSGWSSSAIGLVYGGAQSDWPFAMADLRVYDRSLRDEEIVALSA